MQTTYAGHLDETARLDALIETFSSTLNRGHRDALGRAVTDVIRDIVVATNVERGTLVELSGAPGTIDTTYRWARPTIAGGDATPQSATSEWIVRRLAMSEDAVLLGPPADDGDAGATGAIGITMTAHGLRRCALVLESFAAPRPWPDCVVERLQVLGDLLTAAMYQLRGGHSNDAAPVRTAAVPRTASTAAPNRPESQTTLDGIVGQSATLRTAMSRVKEVAVSDATVLLLGETGTGKELFARAIHANSSRARHPLVSINCAALPPALVESELFGHERGAFTGAFAPRVGRFEQANRGTLFLDEVGDLPLEIQAKLLRVLQQRTFERLGSSQTRAVDVRIIAATHRDLDALVEEGQFREDLYYRLSVFPITLPPLRDRLEDIPSLLWSIIRKRQHAMRRSIATVSEATMAMLQAHSWPGNIRELENVIERALIRSTGSELQLADDDLVVSAAKTVARGTLLAVERAHIEEVLRTCEWRINGDNNAAERLGLHPNTLRFRMRKLGIIRSPAAPSTRSAMPRVARSAGRR